MRLLKIITTGIALIIVVPGLLAGLAAVLLWPSTFFGPTGRHVAAKAFCEALIPRIEAY
jgi:hypothetical protein